MKGHAIGFPFITQVSVVGNSALLPTTLPPPLRGKSNEGETNGDTILVTAVAISTSLAFKVFPRSGSDSRL